MNLLARLLDFASSPKAHEEDPITEILGHLLSIDRDLLMAFLGALEKMAPKRVWSSLGQPRIQTQYTVPEADPQAGLCRYDLLFRWPKARTQLVIEVKVNAPLTYKTLKTPKGTLEDVDQLQRYLDIAKLQPQGFVMGLGIQKATPTRAVRKHERFLGCMGWQTVHDVFLQALQKQERVRPHAALIEDFIDLLEVYQMAHPKMTFEGLASFYPSQRFYNTFCTTLYQVEQTLRSQGLLQAFEAASDRTWQDKFKRSGYRLFLNKNRGRFAFIGMVYDDRPTHDEIPDLYFFLEVEQNSKAQEILDDDAAQIQKAICKLDANALEVQWAHRLGGYQTISCRMSLVEVLRAQDPALAMEAFFKTALQAAQKEGLLDVFLKAAAT